MVMRNNDPLQEQMQTFMSAWESFVEKLAEELRPLMDQLLCICKALEKSDNNVGQY